MHCSHVSASEEGEKTCQSCFPQDMGPWGRQMCECGENFSKDLSFPAWGSASRAGTIMARVTALQGWILTSLSSSPLLHLVLFICVWCFYFCTFVKLYFFVLPPLYSVLLWYIMEKVGSYLILLSEEGIRLSRMAGKDSILFPSSSHFSWYRCPICPVYTAEWWAAVISIILWFFCGKPHLLYFDSIFSAMVGLGLMSDPSEQSVYAHQYWGM